MLQRLVNFINLAHLRFMAFCYRDYSSKQITDAIRMYYDIIREMTQAQAFDEISHMFIDIEIFKKKYKGLIPPNMFDERTIRLEEILIKETERVMNIKRRPALMRKKR